MLEFSCCVYNIVRPWVPFVKGEIVETLPSRLSVSHTQSNEVGAEPTEHRYRSCIIA